MSDIKNQNSLGIHKDLSAAVNGLKWDRSVVYLTVTSVPWSSAHSMYVVKMCQAMGEMGAGVELVCCVPWRAPRGAQALVPYGITNPSFRLRQIIAPYGIPIPGRPEWETRFYWAAFAHFFLVMASKLNQSHRKIIFIAHHPLTAIACALLKVEYAYDFHAVQFQRRLTRAIINTYPPKVCFVQSEALQTQMAKILPAANFVLARNAVDKAFFSIPAPPSVQGATTIGYIGSLGADRGIEELLISFQQLVREEPQARLIIAGGKQPEVTRLQSRVAKLSLTSGVSIFGHLSQEEVTKTLAQCDILVAYYRPGLPAVRYMSPMKLFEYMAAGRAIIASDVAVIREFATHGKDIWLVDAERPAELTSALFRLYRDSELRKALGQAARKSQHLTTWAERGKIYLSSLMGECKDSI